jgi:hypothetical protein
MGAMPLFHFCMCVNGCSATCLRVCVFMGATQLFHVCVCVNAHKREKVALYPLTHTHTRKKVTLHPLTHTQTSVFMGATLLFVFCVCVNRCNATFFRVCVCVYGCNDTCSRLCVQSGVALINTHTNVKKLRCTHKHTHTRKKVALHP